MGRRMALDLGEKRIGVAVSDETGLVARSYTVFKRSSRLADFEKIGRIIDQEAITLLIIGLPVLLSGEEGTKVAWVRDYGADLAKRLDIEIEFWDESLSTVAAEDSLRERGVHGRKRRERVDAVAAAFILQSYLDAHRE
ncbi:MAG: Holliday junction resolvase RuvX [Candidatus Promineifilaceae bacterium]